VSERSKGDRTAELIAGTPYIGVGGTAEPYRIAVCGLMHSGKSTIADQLVRSGYKRQAFAAPVKEFAATAVNNIYFDKARVLGAEPWALLSADDLNKDKEKYRVLFQWIGNFARETFGDDFWVKLYAATYADDAGSRVVVDDLRYVNEAEFLRSRGYQIIRVERPEPARIESIQAAYEKNHGRRLKKKELKALGRHGSESEVRDIKVDRIIQNNGSINQLLTTLNMIVGRTF
jgi:dephospho-CoA kinase